MRATGFPLGRRGGWCGRISSLRLGRGFGSADRRLCRLGILRENRGGQQGGDSGGDEKAGHGFSFQVTKRIAGLFCARIIRSPTKTGIQRVLPFHDGGRFATHAKKRASSGWLRSASTVL